MRKIALYSLPYSGSHTMMLPVGAILLRGSVTIYNCDLKFVAEVDPECTSKVETDFRMVGVGEPVPSESEWALVGSAYSEAFTFDSRDPPTIHRDTVKCLTSVHVYVRLSGLSDDAGAVKVK